MKLIYYVILLVIVLAIAAFGLYYFYQKQERTSERQNIVQSQPQADVEQKKEPVNDNVPYSPKIPKSVLSASLNGFSEVLVVDQNGKKLGKDFLGSGSEVEEIEKGIYDYDQSLGVTLVLIIEPELEQYEFYVKGGKDEEISVGATYVMDGCRLDADETIDTSILKNQIKKFVINIPKLCGVNLFFLRETN